MQNVVRLSLLLACGLALQAAGLDVAFDANGIQQIRYNGVVLEDLSRNPSDAFHIWHMKSTDLQGNTIGAGQYGWGEANNGRSWNAATHTWTYSFVGLDLGSLHPIRRHVEPASYRKKSRGLGHRI